MFIVWLGYSLGYYGVDQIRGGNNGLLSLMNPFKQFVEQPQDSGGTPVGTAAPGAVATNPASGTRAGSNPAGVAAISVIPAPAGAPAGTYGVDQNGTIYRKVAGAWTVYTRPNQTAPDRAA